MKKHRILSAEQVAIGKQMRRDGKTFDQIAAALGVCRQHAARVCAVANVTRGRSPELVQIDARDAEIVAAYNGSNAEEIAARFGIKVARVHQITHKARKAKRNAKNAEQYKPDANWPSDGADDGKARRDECRRAFDVAKVLNGRVVVPAPVKRSSVPARISAPFVGGGSCALADL